MQLTARLLDVVRAADRFACKQCSRAGYMTAFRDETTVQLVNHVWLFRDTKIRIDYSCGCRATVVEPRKWNVDHPEYEARRPK